MGHPVVLKEHQEPFSLAAVLEINCPKCFLSLSSGECRAPCCAVLAQSVRAELLRSGMGVGGQGMGREPCSPHSFLTAKSIQWC